MFFDQYQSVSFEKVHGDWMHLLDDRQGLALDVGAGSGRDAYALAGRGWDVIAVEPADALRHLAEANTEEQSIQWIADRLPELERVRKLSIRFDLILVSAVWMHLAPTVRERAFRILSELLAPDGLLVITLRHGPGDGKRTFYDVSRAELEQFARKRALVGLSNTGESQADALQRKEVTWETVVFRLPDDGTGALPTIRHIIVNDNKSSTYKLGLIRTLVRIAESAPGLVLKRSDDWVDLPLGALGLFWITLYHPLVLKQQLRQAPGGRGYGFAKEDFYNLRNLSPLDFRVGMALSPDVAPVVLGAVRDAANNILRNPARFTTWPGTEKPIFQGEAAGFRIPRSGARLDRETLSKFGIFQVPAFLWDTFSRYSCWIEPAVVNEWIELMAGWEMRYSMDSYHQAMKWAEGRRDTKQMRQLVESQLAEGDVYCVWTGDPLSKAGFEIDHCFPWSRWYNNDLWNLLPASHRANAAKLEKLPSDATMKKAKPLIVNWWEEAILRSPYEEQFYSEAEASLPLLENARSTDSVFEAMLQQRLRLRRNLQLVEWMGMGP